MIAAIGDSITYGAGSSKGGYPAMLTAKLQADGYTVNILNKGESGEKAYQTHKRFNKALKAADIVLLMIGFNDLTKPEQCPEPHNCRTIEYITAMLDAALNAGRVPIVSTVTPAQPGNVRAWANPAIQHLNTQIQALAAEREIAVVDNYQALWEKRAESVFADHAHPNDRGYAIITDQWYTALRQNQLLLKN